MPNTQEENVIVTQDSEIAQLRKELRTTRVFTAISSLLMVCILVGGFLVCSKAKEYVEQIWPVVEQLSTVDFEAINDTMEVVEEAVGAVDWEYMSQQLGALDVDAINEAIAGLDTEELTKALANINEAAETLQKLSDGMKSFTSKFGF